MKTTRTLSLLAPTLALTAFAGAGISNMYITNGAGEIYVVDGNTLQATSIAQLDNAGTINDIQYLGNGKILANLTFAMATYDLNTGVQETLFTSNGTFGQPDSFVYTGGLARRVNGDMYFGVTEALNPSGVINYGISFDMQSDSLNQIGNVPFATPFDFYELANGSMIGLITGDRAVRFDPNTGAVQAEFDLDVSAVSFVQSLTDLYVIATDGSLYTFDINDASTEFYGQITGFENNILGASIANASAALIPSPASLFALSGGLCLGLRRRRKH